MGPGLGARLLCSSLPHGAHDWAPEPRAQSAPGHGPQQEPAGLQRERAQAPGTEETWGQDPAPPIFISVALFLVWGRQMGL